MMIYLRNMSLEGMWADGQAAALHFFSRLVMNSIQWNGQNIHWEGGAWGLYSVISFQLHLPEGRRDFCPYLALIRSVMVSIHDGNFLSARLILL